MENIQINEHNCSEIENLNSLEFYILNDKDTFNDICQL